MAGPRSPRHGRSVGGSKLRGRESFRGLPHIVGHATDQQWPACQSTLISQECIDAGREWPCRWHSLRSGTIRPSCRAGDPGQEAQIGFRDDHDGRTAGQVWLDLVPDLLSKDSFRRHRGWCGELRDFGRGAGPTLSRGRDRLSPSPNRFVDRLSGSEINPFDRVTGSFFGTAQDERLVVLFRLRRFSLLTRTPSQRRNDINHCHSRAESAAKSSIRASPVSFSRRKFCAFSRPSSRIHQRSFRLCQPFKLSAGAHRAEYRAWYQLVLTGPIVPRVDVSVPRSSLASGATIEQHAFAT